MKNPLKRKPNRYEAELDRLLEDTKNFDPISDEYHSILMRINELDKIHNRTTELKKTIIPAVGTIGGVVGIYALQQFAGVIVPKALDALASRSSQKKSEDQD